MVYIYIYIYNIHTHTYIYIYIMYIYPYFLPFVRQDMAFLKWAAWGDTKKSIKLGGPPRKGNSEKRWSSHKKGGKGGFQKIKSSSKLIRCCCIEFIVAL